ncbi:MAG: spondin domain-containing protein [Sneathiella sp.]|uniref:spondin domain-containing protein n=1 Tax=Sneathiella sp. TaxID=1964365 RepID=UPI0030014976
MVLKKISHIAGGAILTASLLALTATASYATSVKITVTNLAQPGGFAITPLYTAFHNNSFDAFDVGNTASAGLELLAELGDPSVIAGIRTAADPNSVGGVLTAGTPPPIQAGETVSRVFTLDGNDHAFFTFLAMILPSNDSFIGSDDAIRIFDNSGNFLGDQTINVTGADIFDAGTEVNNAALDGGAAPTNNPMAGVAENGFITAGQSLNAFAGQVLFGQELTLEQIDFFSDPGNFQVARIEISAVPLPAALPLFGAALLGMGFLSRRRKNLAKTA